MASATGTLTLVGLMRPLTTLDQHMLLDSKLCITACSLESLALLGIESAALEEAQGQNKLRLDLLVDGWNTTLAADLANEAGVRICFIATSSASGNTAATSQGDRSWVHAHLQSTVLPGGTPVHVLHWRHAEASENPHSGTARVASAVSGRESQGLSQSSDEGESNGESSSHINDSRRGVSIASTTIDQAPSARLSAHTSGRLPPSPPLLVMGRDSPAEAERFVSDQGASKAQLLGASVPLLAPKRSIKSKDHLNASCDILDPEVSHNPLERDATPPAIQGPATSEPKPSSRLARGESVKVAQSRVIGLPEGPNSAPIRKGGENDRGSYASSHVTHGVRLQERVRRVIGVGTGTLMPGLSILLRISVAMAILVIALAITMTAFIHTTRACATSSRSACYSISCFSRPCSRSSQRLVRKYRRGQCW